MNNKKITTQEIEPQVRSLREWKLDDPGIYSYYAFDMRGPIDGNLRTLDTIRLDILAEKKLESIPLNSIFEMKIAFIWWDIDLDHSGYYSDDIFSCIKL